MRDLILALILITTQTVFAQQPFIPDAFPIVISEFELTDGSIIRGKVKRMVPDRYYEIRTVSRKTFTIRNEQIIRKEKVLPTFVENSSAFGLGTSFYTPLTMFAPPLYIGFLLRGTEDFGPNNHWSYYAELSPNILISGDAELGDNPSFMSYAFGFSYKRNRGQTLSQEFGLGVNHIQGIIERGATFLDIRITNSIAVSRNTLISAYISYLHPVRNDQAFPMLVFGSYVTLFTPSAKF